MKVEFDVLNEHYSYDCDSFEMEQDSSGYWTVYVDGEAKVEDSEFAPFHVEAEA